jgi:hypothetical protein
MNETGQFASHSAGPAPAADEPTRREHYGCLDDDGGRLTQAWDNQQNANGPEDKADEKDYDRVERARTGCLKHPNEGGGSLCTITDY